MSSSILVLTGKDVAKLLESPSTVDTALSSQRNAFQAYSQPADAVSPDARVPVIQAPLRTTLSSEHATTLVMPARADAQQDLGGIGIKVVSVPHEGDAGLPATTTIFDEKTGRLRAVVNARSLTALRNACGQSWSCTSYHISSARLADLEGLFLAGSTLYLQTVFDPTSPETHPRNLVMFGSGAQIRAHAILFKSKFPSITSMTIIGRRRTDRLERLGDELRNVFGRTLIPDSETKVEVGVDGEEGFSTVHAVGQADVIVAATPSTSPLFSSSAVLSRLDGKTKKTTIILIGSYKPHMREIDDGLVRRSLQDGGKITVDSREACLAEAGELVGVDPGDCVELGEVLNGESSGKNDREVRIYKSVGIAVQDVAVANAMIEAAEQHGAGTVIEDYD